jgi:vancomycin resistance protein YoaR
LKLSKPEPILCETLFRMPKKSKQKKRFSFKKAVWKQWWKRTLVVVFGLVVLLGVTGAAYTFVFSEKVYQGVFLGNLPLSGLTPEEVRTTIGSSLDALDQQGLTFVFRDRVVNVPTVVTATEDPDLSYELISFNAEEMVLAVARFGRAGSSIRKWQERLSGLISRSVITPEFTWREKAIAELLKENLATLEHPALEAKLSITNGVASVTSERDGIVFNYEKALAEARAQLETLQFTPIPLKLKKDVPVLTRNVAEPLLTRAQDAVYSTGVSIAFEGRTWFWPARTINDLFEIRLQENSSKPELGLSRERLLELLAPIESHINLEPQEPRFALEEGRVVEFKTNAPGRRVVIEDTTHAWEQELFEKKSIELEPVVETLEPLQKIADVNDLGITELLGVGKSNFGGSPVNRRHNIRVGAEAVNGTLIPPGEEFSLLKTLGTIDRSTGYRQELVIKGNQTIPEYGGGLCQIGTTTFRGTLAAGLPVTARRNHSYSVPYYYDAQGKPGTDATIYDPAPDYRFKNDTGNHVLITTRIEGDDLFFEYWGTNDGRTIEQSETRTWDYVPPPETKYVETLDLAVGETKCTESPHAGIKAAFDYIVTYADGTSNEETFKSQYRPWQEVCLIGVEELSPEATEEGLDIEGADLIDATI